MPIISHTLIVNKNFKKKVSTLVLTHHKVHMKRLDWQVAVLMPVCFESTDQTKMNSYACPTRCLEAIIITLFAIPSMWFRFCLIEHKCWFGLGSLKDTAIYVLFVNLLSAWMNDMFFLISLWLHSNAFLMGRSISSNISVVVHFNGCKQMHAQIVNI